MKRGVGTGPRAKSERTAGEVVCDKNEHGRTCVHKVEHRRRAPEGRREAGAAEVDVDQRLQAGPALQRDPELLPQRAPRAVTCSHTAASASTAAGAVARCSGREGDRVCGCWAGGAEGRARETPWARRMGRCEMQQPLIARSRGERVL